MHCPLNGFLIIAAADNILKAVSLRMVGSLFKECFNSVRFFDIFKGVGRHCANALTVNLHITNGIAVMWRDGKGLMASLSYLNCIGRRNHAVFTGGSLDGVAVRTATATIGPVGFHGHVLARHDKGGCRCGSICKCATIGCGPADKTIMWSTAGIQCNLRTCDIAPTAILAITTIQRYRQTVGRFHGNGNFRRRRQAVVIGDGNSRGVCACA